jgi:hypothetical protein
MFSHDPPRGVYSGMIPIENSHTTNAGVLWPTGLSSTSSIRNGGNSVASVGLIDSPSCQRRQDGRQLLLEPAVQHLVGAGGHASDPDLAIGGVEQRHHLGRAVTEIFVRLARRMSFGLPRRAGMRHGLERAGLVGAPGRDAHRLAESVGVLDQLSFDAVSGSVTTTAPLWRLRSTVPVGHQGRSFCGEAPASWSTRPMV